MADRVFDDRLGLWIINPANLPVRLPRIRSFQGGVIRDLFLPRDATPADMQRVRDAGFSAHLWTARDGLAAGEYTDRALADIARLRAGACELNIEGVPDEQLGNYLRFVVALIRAQRSSYRLRLNLAPWKGFAVAASRLASDPALYVCAQNYGGNMDELYSPADVLRDLLDQGIPPGKATVCYAAACRVLGSAQRQRTLPDLTRTRRGVIFSDDLMFDAGLL